MVLGGPCIAQNGQQIDKKKRRKEKKEVPEWQRNTVREAKAGRKLGGETKCLQKDGVH